MLEHRYSYRIDLYFIPESVSSITNNNGVKYSIMGRSSVGKMDE